MGDAEGLVKIRSVTAEVTSLTLRCRARVRADEFRRDQNLERPVMHDRTTTHGLFRRCTGYEVTLAPVENSRSYCESRFLEDRRMLADFLYVLALQLRLTSEVPRAQ